MKLQLSLRTLLAEISLIVFLTLIENTQALPPTIDPTYGIEPKVQTPAPPSGPTSKWIWGPKAENETIFARVTFLLPKVPKEAALSITADDGFELHVNGQRVGASPPVGDRTWANVQRFQVAKFLTTGRNVIAVRAFNAGGAAGLIARLDVDGKELLTTDEQWRVTDCVLPKEWTQVTFDDSQWPRATVVAALGEGPWGRGLVNWPGLNNDAPYMAHLAIAPKSAQAVAGSEQFISAASFGSGGETQVKVTPAAGKQPGLVLDFGQELAGRLQVWGTDGAAITVTTGESREECDHQEPQLNNNGPFTLQLAGSDPASTPYTAFRYAKLTFPASTPVELTRIICDHKYYPVQYKGTFDCSDPLLTRIWYTGAYTAHLCMQEEIWDAPKRDRGLWIGDMQVSGETINTVFGDKFLMEHSIGLVRDQAQGGRPPTELPTQDVNGLPGYSAAWFCTLADFYRHQGDKGFLASQHDKIISLLKYQQTEFNQQNVYINGTKWDFCDWAPGFVTDSPLARATTYLYIIHGLHEAVFLLRELGDSANADKYSAWADQLTVAARSQFENPGTHTFSDRLQENVMAVLSGTATPKEGAGIYTQFLQADSPVWKVHMTGNIDESEVMSPYYGYFVLQAMAKLGQPQAGLELIRRYWGDMLRRGATTLWEKFDPVWPEDMKATLDKMPYLSLSHGWSTGPTSFLTETILGVRPTGAGFKTVEIRPQLGDLTWAEGDVPTPNGLIHVRVDRKGDSVTASVTLPANVSATISLGGKSLKADQPGVYQVTALTNGG